MEDILGKEHDVFIDREKELKLLKDSIDSLKAEGKGKIFIITGSVGTGKSFLANALKDYAKSNNINWLEGVCVSKDGEPFHPLKYAFIAYRDKKRRSYINLPLSIRIADRWSKEDDEKGIFNADYKNTLQNSYEYIRDITEENPFVFLLDDMHWADKHTLLMIRFLSNKLENMRAIFLCAYRPEDSTDHNLLKETMNFISHGATVEYVNIEPFDRKDTEKLISDIVNAKPINSFVDMIHDSTGGNSLFITETVKSMMSNKIIDTEEDRYITDPSEIVWPAVVKYAIERKLIRLDEETKSFLVSLSVLGKKFKFAHIKEFSDKDEMDILDILDEIMEREILKEMGNSEEYSFFHPVTREILYSELSSGKKRVLHTKAAEVIEKCSGDDLEKYYDVLADHYLKSGQNKKATEYLYKAGRFYEENGEITRCINKYRRANEMLLENRVEDIDVNDLSMRFGTNLYNHGVALKEDGDPNTCQRYIEEALEVFNEIHMEDWVAKCYAILDDIGQ